MTGETSVAITGSMIVKLARGVRLRRDDVRGQTVLLAPELAMALDEIAIKIVEALDGKRSIDTIADDFAAEFQAPREQIATDVLAFIRELANRRMLQVL
ncbi:pyrroloquinoline quinone biosynthesis peptide chaperone PqqD [Rhizobium sp. 18055]|uniref:pyrroloquinoline quinone biosynthesis peptide chaperone PqqD n=1 Tax=Rhizobium sp. 18055 TaxID=2681403 RepID=UPI0013597AFC|nr:pyrroloquinoline quinone biosynthesis peptide chaperone PqqD [Rhizobium sp. 18055]